MLPDKPMCAPKCQSLIRLRLIVYFIRGLSVCERLLSLENTWLQVPQRAVHASDKHSVSSVNQEAPRSCVVLAILLFKF